MLEKNGRYLHLIDSSKHSKHDQIKIDKVNHCNFNDLKKKLLPWLIVITWTSTSRSKYVPLKIMDEINYPLTIEVWELPLENFITHFKIYTGITTQGLPFLKVWEKASPA